ncbi:MAG: disulfide reductase [Candidatus Aminicenantes bacterium]|nr:disulfide reductase [Candidatus Aminicenantes bacterium]
MNRYAYFPGCSLKGNSRSYEESILPVFRDVGLPLEELEDWNCCGATAYFSVDDNLAVAISGRNLSLAERANKDIIAPCAGCYLTLRKSNEFLAGKTTSAAKIRSDLKNSGCEYHGTVKVKHPLDVLKNDVGLETLKARVRRPLAGLKVASYYGCQLVRPFTDFDDPDHPTALDDLLAAVGAAPVEYGAKTRCCGGSLTGTIEEVGLRLNYILLKEAKRQGADCLATICPLCQFNLEFAQDKIVKAFGEDVRLPVLYFSQLLGLAMGLGRKELGLTRSIVPLKSFYAKLGNGGAR